MFIVFAAGNRVLNTLTVERKGILLHGGEKIWMLCSSGKSNISIVSTAYE